jgi:hypothetical protein
MEADVVKARQHVQEIMHRRSDDPRSQQLIHEALREAEAALHTATRAFEQAKKPESSPERLNRLLDLPESGGCYTAGASASA